MSDQTTLLAHWTCADGYAGIRRSNLIVPRRQPALGPGVALVWLTDMWTIDTEADRLALGLTSISLSCDRTEYRFTVAVDEMVEPWSAWAHRHRVPLALREGLEGEPGAQPRHWWVSEDAVPPLTDASRAHRKAVA